MYKDLINLGKKDNIDIEVKNVIEENYYINIFNGVKQKYIVS